MILSRGDKDTVSAKRLQEILVDQAIHLERFSKKYQADVILNDHNLFDHEVVIEALKARIEQAQAL